MGEVLNNNGMVTFQMKAGKDFVSAIMPEKNRDIIIANAKSVVEDTSRRGFNTCVDGTYYFNIEKPEVEVEEPEKVEKPKRNKRGRSDA